MFADDWQLTAGIRNDRYSDFGSTVNPRAALVWDMSAEWTSKLLYGRAFRSPSYAEMYTRSPVFVGNPTLHPETIDTWETAFSYRPISAAEITLSLFRYEIEDFITTVPYQGGVGLFSNVGERMGTGGELELSWRPSLTTRLLGNYSYQHSMDAETDARVGDFPAHQFYSRVEWSFLDRWILSPQINYVGEQSRVREDKRDPVDDYTTFDVTLRYKTGSLGGSLSVFNAFDADVREPSPYGNPLAIPGDFPMPGRALMAEINTSF